MEAQERKLRLKEEIRANILEAAFRLAKANGWEAVSMRKIATEIAHTAPVIYDYFQNKEAIMRELARAGYQQLTAAMTQAQQQQDQADQQLEAMWMAYLHFAQEEKEYYQLMFGIGVPVSGDNISLPEITDPVVLIGQVIRQQGLTEQLTDEEVERRAWTQWSVVHGLISLGRLFKEDREAFNRSVLQDLLRAANVNAGV
ncbi:TetR/AcrR family transcriptional regulator [Chitinophaga rhizophila]|uniref:TetR/AcrR family transcriptional regulator n=1 Tax=Chitinophaga rhizophila TaxID=2866212 RepID=A0ABS7G580_9BACT|nr:TetR/AcrR family transcriptional regulator [Chitinophaga rhizophila]MBW8682808.1 TetR/AcrR family transcriptional regulator [Chitinophaga rhizophila]